MKTRLFALLFALPFLFVAAPARAADDDVSTYEIANTLENPEYASQLEGVSYYFGSSPGGRRIERDVTTSQRTRKFGRSAEAACQHVLASALIRLHDHAISVGGNAVVNIRSNWNNVEWSSSTQYQCAVGGLMAGVALKADIVSR